MVRMFPASLTARDWRRSLRRVSENVWRVAPTLADLRSRGSRGQPSIVYVLRQPPAARSTAIRLTRCKHHRDVRKQEAQPSYGAHAPSVLRSLRMASL
jgi:hypothetical protein